MKWSRRKAAKDEEVRDLKEQVEEGRLLLGREEQEVQALHNFAQQLREKSQELRRQLQVGRGTAAPRQGGAGGPGPPQLCPPAEGEKSGAQAPATGRKRDGCS
jgi:hypothetical protein